MSSVRRGSAFFVRLLRLPLMQTETTTRNHYLRAAVIFGVCLVLIFILRFVGHLLHSSLLFSAPQFIFPYEGLVVRGADSYHHVLSHTVARILTFTQWGLVYICFVWFARRIPTLYMVLAAIGVIMILFVAQCIGLGLFGMSVAIDGRP
jgi:hypothetical protein